MEINVLPVTPSIQINFSHSSSYGKGNVGFTDFCGKLTCFHQGSVAQYFVISGELHKTLRTALDTGDPQKITQAATNLEYFLNSSFKHAWLETVDLLRAHYTSRDSKHLPRFCIKATRGTSEGGHMIVDIFRGDGKRNDNDVPISTNTGFEKVYTKGTYYIENNIPKEAKKEQYKNPRLNLTKVGAYRRPTFLTSNRRKGIDLKWAECWSDFDRTTPVTAQACYRSTLITPMTLRGNKLTDYFKERTKVGMEVERVMYGFFCMDHVACDFFNTEDVTISYMVADWLSLYIIGRQNYVPHSETFLRARAISTPQNQEGQPQLTNTQVANGNTNKQQKGKRPRNNR